MDTWDSGERYSFVVWTPEKFNIVVCPGEGPIHEWLRPLTGVATVFFLVRTRGKQKRLTEEPRPVAKLSRTTREDSHPDLHEPDKGAGSHRRLPLDGSPLAKESSTISEGGEEFLPNPSPQAQPGACAARPSAVPRALPPTAPGPSKIGHGAWRPMSLVGT